MPKVPGVKRDKMPSGEELKLINFKASVKDVELWKEAAYLRRKTLSGFIRDVCNEACELATVSRVSLVTPSPPVRKPAINVAQELLAKTTANTGPCERRLPKGAFCKTCGRIHR